MASYTNFNGVIPDYEYGPLSLIKEPTAMQRRKRYVVTKADARAIAADSSTSVNADAPSQPRELVCYRHVIKKQRVLDAQIKFEELQRQCTSLEQVR